MFPVGFAFDVVNHHAPTGGSVLDPFAGRGSSIYAAAATGRTGCGVEINSVGWLYSSVKLNPAGEKRVLQRLDEIGHLASSTDGESISSLPEFFRRCYATGVLRFLVAARENLNWCNSRIDASLMAILLVYLHGKEGSSLSNQLRQGKAMSPDYCVRWWDERRLDPPDLDPVAFLRQRIEWRYAKGRPLLTQSKVIRGDSMKVLSRLRPIQPFDLLFTSPPYFSITNYHYDQWLRHWVMGGTSRPTKSGGDWQSKFESKVAYTRLLQTVFNRSARLLSPDATVYIRTDARPFTLSATISALEQAFPDKKLTAVPRPMIRQSQTALFGDGLPKPGEVDLILTSS